MMSIIQGKLGVRQARAIRQICVILCLMTCGGCEKQKEQIPKDHFRLTIAEQVDEEHIKEMAGSWGVVVKDIIAKPVALRFVIDTFSEGNLRVDKSGEWDIWWEGWAGGGSHKLLFSNIRSEGVDRNHIRATVTLAALIDYHYRDPKPYPVLLIETRGPNISSGGICHTRKELSDFTIDGPMLDTSLEEGVYEFGSSLEIASFMGESISLEVTR